MTRFVSLGLCLGLAAAAGCGDNLSPTGPIDAADIDVADIDMAIDMAIDMTPPPQFSGTLSVLEVQILNPIGLGNTIMGQGVQVGYAVVDNQVVPAPVLEEDPGGPTGCKVWEYTPTDYLNSLGGNEGTLAVTLTNPNPPPVAPAIETCIFRTGAGYVCPDAGSSGTATSVMLTGQGAGATASALLTLPGGHAASFQATDVGRYVKFEGTGVASLDASYNAFPIVVFMDASNVVIGLPLGTGTDIPLTQGTFATLSGVGPLPTLMDPGMLADDGTGTVTATGAALGGGNHLGDYTVPLAIGDDFPISDATADTLRTIPMDGTAFTVGCDESGGACPPAFGTILSISTTDTTLPAGASPFTFPPPTTKRVELRCASIGVTQITVPAAYSAYIMNSGATRIRTTLSRAQLNIPNPNTTPLNAVSGHSYVGFTTP